MKAHPFGIRSLAAALFVLFAALAMPVRAFAVEPGEMLADPRLEARAREISRELRCLVCQNESIDDSDADLAHDLRLLVRRRLVAGDSDAQVKQYIVDRYGEYVLLKPPFKAATAVLWLGPFVLLFGAAAVAITFYRRKNANATVKPLSGEERRRLHALIGDAANGETRTP